MKNNITGNIGEWSELYALAFLLAKGGVFGADDLQNKLSDVYYKILKVIIEKDTHDNELTYCLNRSEVEVFIDNNLVSKIDYLKIQELSELMFKDLLTSIREGAFELKTGTDLLMLLNKAAIKASSSSKNDLNLVFLDNKTNLASPIIGFSIKSQLGSPSTLINASKSTNFTYEILDSNNKIPQKPPKFTKENIRENISSLINSGYKLIYNNVDNSIFLSNLTKIDSNLPVYLSELLLSYYSQKNNKLTDILKNEFPTSLYKQKVFKIKEFLSIMALGMMPNTSWNGIITSLGGLLIVKRDGNVLCYYIYNLEDFQNYLFNNTKLDTPSTTRHEFGKIIEAAGHYYIKLNLQIRFLK